VASSHKVASHRAVVEQTFADIKRWKVMEGNKVRDAKRFEKVLDCVLGLHNLKVLMKNDPNSIIPNRRNPILNEHIFFPKEELNLSIPNPITPFIRDTVPHVFEFQAFMTSAYGAVSRALTNRGNDAVFFPTVGERGKNLFKGAYLLQLRVVKEDLGVWTIKYTVGASYSYEIHEGYFQMREDVAVIASICDCYSG
jgi:hypothetical protein